MKFAPPYPSSTSQPGWSRAGRRWCRSTSSASSFVYWWCERRCCGHQMYGLYTKGSPQKAAALLTHGAVLSVEWDASCTVGEKSSHCANGSASVAGSDPATHPARQPAQTAKAAAIRAQCSGVALYSAEEQKWRRSSASRSRLSGVSPTAPTAPSCRCCHASPEAGATGTGSGVASAGGDRSSTTRSPAPMNLSMPVGRWDAIGTRSMGGSTGSRAARRVRSASGRRARMSEALREEKRWIV
mmetsp:Transcript_5253/g.17566  ORF Transcript_5253/g.17566 Transcript_5253/m.17566 type:complete len:242 (-) Transcript_5253:332-1057(-)